MGDRLVLWSGGGRFVASKDVASAAIAQSNQLLIDGNLQTFSKNIANFQNIPQSSLQVDWGFGRIENISGATHTKTEASVTAEAWRYTINFVRAGGGTGSAITDSFEHPIVSIGTCEDYTYLKSIVVAQIGTNAPTNVCGESLLFGGYTTTTCATFQRIATLPILNYQSRGVNAFVSFTVTKTSIRRTCTKTEVRVTSNESGQVSKCWKDLNANPTVTTVNNGCILRVFFTDGTSQDLSYPTCPTVQQSSGSSIFIVFSDGTTTTIPLTYQPIWVQVKPANSCPPNTCFECVHDGEKCCFAKDTDGLIKVIDRFHITS